MNILEINNKIYWNNLGADSYLYGTSLSFQDDYVLFDNSRMATSVILNKWSSKTNYQADRKSVQLPLLQRNLNYSIFINIEVEPKGSVYTLIEFFDRYDKLVSFHTLKDTKGEFTYPEDAYYYTISLQNAGAENFKFYYIEISNASS